MIHMRFIQLVAARFCLPLVFIVLVGLAFNSCKSQPEPDLLLGKWKVVYVRTGNQEVGGPTFRGTDFSFRDNGTVMATHYSGDTAVSKYERRGDSLFYLNPAGNEGYRLDSLTKEKLVISAVEDGMPKLVRMVRLKDR